MRRVFLRADGSRAIGFGHIYRLLAIGEILKEDFECTFVINKPDGFILNEIKRTCSQFIDLNHEEHEILDKAKSGKEIAFDMKDYLAGDEILVTDGYLFGPNYQMAAK